MKGVYFDLPAYTFRIKNGGEATNITIKGNIATYGDNVISYIVEYGNTAGVLTVGGKITASGQNSQIEK